MAAPKKRPKAKKARAKRPPKPKRRTPAQIIESVKRRTRVISVYGPFNSRTMLEVPTDLATELLRKPLSESGRTSVISAVERDLKELRKRSPALADSAIAATAVQLAYELENPYNSATSKSMCARSLADAMDRLRELAPAEEEKDKLDDLSARRAARRKRRAAAAS